MNARLSSVIRVVRIRASQYLDYDRSNRQIAARDRRVTCGFWFAGRGTRSQNDWVARRGLCKGSLVIAAMPGFGFAGTSYF